MDQAKIRAWWWHRQGLDGELAGKPAGAVLERAGWARSVAGVSPYLTLFSRAGIGREPADQAVAKLEIHELPAARGCTYVVPAVDFALALTVGQAFGDSDMKVARKLGVTDAEVDKLCSAVVTVLGNGPLDPDGIREAVGDAARNLGAEGQKKGVTTTLPLALGRLQLEGEIRRVPMNGRLDQQRYRYTLWRPNPLAKAKMKSEEAFTELARRYFSWIAPATMAQFQWFSGLSGKAAKAAVEPLKLVPIESGDERLLLPADVDAFRAFKISKTPQYALVGSLDSINALQRDLKALLDDEDAERPVMTEKGTRAGASLQDVPSHAILDRGRVIGFWEYDTTAESIVWMTFRKADKALQEAVKRTEEYVRTQLGDARSFSLDTPKSRAPKVEALRKAAGKG